MISRRFGIFGINFYTTHGLLKMLNVILIPSQWFYNGAQFS